MKFLVDAQLPQSLSFLLIELGNDSVHTLQLPQKNFSTDTFISKFSIEENRVLITKDTDFLESFILHAKPKKLIMVRTGNIGNVELFKNNFEKIKELLSHGNLIEITKEDIVLHH